MARWKAEKEEMEKWINMEKEWMEAIKAAEYEAKKESEIMELERESNMLEDYAAKVQ